jgi:hypothetical protein
VLPAEADRAAASPHAGAEVQRHLWDSRYGPVLIEVAGGAIFVNGQRVEPLRSLPPATGVSRRDGSR